MQRLLFCSLLILPFAASAVNCETLTGSWQGFYQDTQGLFVNKSFPVELVLTYQAPYLYGYTLPSKDHEGAGYGAQAPAFLWATCESNTISNLYLLPAYSTCGAGQPQPNLSVKQGMLSFDAHWQNAMIDTVFRFSLKRDTIPEVFNKQWGRNVETIAHTPLKTCH